jgi:hypothetical protein
MATTSGSGWAAGEARGEADDTASSLVDPPLQDSATGRGGIVLGCALSDERAAAVADDLALGDDLRAFIDASPSPAHAVAEMARRLGDAGFRPLDEADAWELSPGDRRYVVRDDASLIAFRVGLEPAAEAGWRLIGAHTDSPTYARRATGWWAWSRTEACWPIPGWTGS